MIPHAAVAPNTWAFLSEPMIAPTGFREYDARWRYPDDINLPGVTALGLGLGTQMHERSLRPEIAVGNDYRDYSLAIKNALTLGLMQAGRAGARHRARRSRRWPISRSSIWTRRPSRWSRRATTPTAGPGSRWASSGPLTHGPEDMVRLRDIVLGGEGVARDGGGHRRVEGVREAYLDDLVGDFRMTRPPAHGLRHRQRHGRSLRTEVLERIGVEVIPSHNRLDYTFPHYNPNPEALEMLHDMADQVRRTRADLALGFDGDGDRCGVVDDEGEEIFADKRA
jgi:phosphomannomutase/phosphoglucomutase